MPSCHRRRSSSNSGAGINCYYPFRQVAILSLILLLPAIVDGTLPSLHRHAAISIRQQRHQIWRRRMGGIPSFILRVSRGGGPISSVTSDNNETPSMDYNVTLRRTSTPNTANYHHVREENGEEESIAAAATKNGGDELDDIDIAVTSTTTPSTKTTASKTATAAAEIQYVTKKDGTMELFNKEKILRRLQNLSSDIDSRYVSRTELAQSITDGLYPNITTTEIDILASETSASRSTSHPDYARLAARICITANHKSTPNTFSEAMLILNHSGEKEEEEISTQAEVRDNGVVVGVVKSPTSTTLSSSSSKVDTTRTSGNGFVCNDIADLVRRRGHEINARIHTSRDMELSYFGFKTLERSYLLKVNESTIAERPQYMWMRVALGIHCCKPRVSDSDGDDANKTNNTEGSLSKSSLLSKESMNYKDQEDANLNAAFETYDLMSQGYFTHASPTLFHAGTMHPQLCSCFLLKMSDDSINGIYDTLKHCALISKAAGGIGLCVNKIRARGTFIKGTRGVSNGLVPMLRVYDSTSHYVDQGGGKRPGAFAVYLEPWHADVFDVLNLRKNHGKEEQRARNLFYGLWVPDLFMKRVEEDGMWSLMCPHLCPGLAECHGKEFERLYTEYESNGQFVRQVRARTLWAAIIDAQIETGTPYLLYKDAANEKSNQKNLGTIQCSNLCTEIIQYTNEEEVAVCNLASINLSKFVVSEKGRYGSTTPGMAYFDHEALHKVAKIITKNLDNVIDVNQYPIEGAEKSNRRHRPMGIGVSGLADAFLRLGLPFSSSEAKELNEAIFETIYHAALEASNEIAQKKGSYATFDGSPASEGKLQYNLWGVSDNETPSRRCQSSKMKLQKYGKRVNEEGGYDWDKLRRSIISGGLRNSLLVAPMPTASTSQILGVNECFEPFASNLYVRRVKAGEFIIINPHLIQDLTDLGIWNKNVRNQLMRDGGSVAKIDCIPDRLKDLYKTVWEMKMKDIIDMAADRGKFIDQSQSLNLFMAVPTVNKLTAMHFYAWKKGLKTGMYYLRTRPAVNAIQFTVPKSLIAEDNGDFVEANSISLSNNIECLSCSA